MTGGASRAKGLRGEHEVADLFKLRGFSVRGLEGSGDWLAFRPAPQLPFFAPAALTLHLEVKRQERLRLPEWIAQAKAEAPSGVPPVVVFRQNRTEWIAALPLADLLEVIRS